MSALYHCAVMAGINARCACAQPPPRLWAHGLGCGPVTVYTCNQAVGGCCAACCVAAVGAAADVGGGGGPAADVAAAGAGRPPSAAAADAADAVAAVAAPETAADVGGDLAAAVGWRVVLLQMQVRAGEPAAAAVGGGHLHASISRPRTCNTRPRQQRQKWAGRRQQRSAHKSQLHAHRGGMGEGEASCST